MTLCVKPVAQISEGRGGGKLKSSKLGNWECPRLSSHSDLTIVTPFLTGSRPSRPSKALDSDNHCRGVSSTHCLLVSLLAASKRSENHAHAEALALEFGAVCIPTPNVLSICLRRTLPELKQAWTSVWNLPRDSQRSQRSLARGSCQSRLGHVTPCGERWIPQGSTRLPETK